MRVCVSIAVSRPQGRLDPLPGAIEASHDFVKWATAAGFDRVVAVTDEASGSQEKFVDLWDMEKRTRCAISALNEVTVTDLTSLFRDILGDSAEIVDHLVLHFSGHGFAGNMDNQFLLLTNWRRNTTEAIDVSVFVHLLQYYQPRRVSMFLDACRSKKPDEAIELRGHGILEITEEEPVEFLEDRFRPAIAGTSAFMLKDLNGGPPKCAFSTVLLQALGGEFEEALEDRGAGKAVTSVGLYRALTKRLAEAAKRFDLTLRPSLRPGFVPPDDVYSQLPIDFVPPELPTPLVKPEAEELLQLERLRDPLGRAASNIRLPDVNEESLEEQRKQDLMEEFRKGYSSERRPTYYETGAGVALFGGKIRDEPVIAPPLRAERDQSLQTATQTATWWRLEDPTDHHNRLQQAGSLLIQLENGTWVGAAALPAMILTISLADCVSSPQSPGKRSPGAVSAIYRGTTGWVPDAVETSNIAEELTSRLRVGAFTADQALSVGAKIRGMKHVNPMLGAIAAYLYDSAGDRDSIRRIAWFYPQFHQAIPFDVALLAGLTGYRNENGRIFVDLPALPARAPRTDEEKRHKDYFKATTEMKDVCVAGGFPWLRQGWTLLEIARLPVHPAVAKLAPHVLSAPFTTLDDEGGRRLAEIIRNGEA